MANCRVLEELFKCLGLAHSCKRFLSQGYKQLQDVLCIEKDEMETLIESSEDRAKFRRLYEEQNIVSLWLEDLGLEVYQDTLFSHGMTSLKSFLDVKNHSEEISGIVNPVHRKRLLRAVQVLVESVRSRVLAVGGWGGHEQAEGGRIGCFLCLTAKVHKKSHKERPTPPTVSRSIRFLVDSGSDVVTLRPDVIHDLKLDQIGIAKQTGAGGVVVKTRVYSACVEIGGKTIPVEVVGDSLDSLGTSVLRYFNHTIHNDQHFWLDKTF